MTYRTLRRGMLALALVAPITAAHPTETSPAAPAVEAFEQSFAGFTALPAANAPGEGSVDVINLKTAIEHRHSGADETAKGLGSGGASYYATKFHGRRTASGERFDNSAMTAAHRTLPFGSKVRVTNQANGKTVVVRINDRGPFHKGRTIDVSHAAAKQLGLIARGHGTVALALLD